MALSLARKRSRRKPLVLAAAVAGVVAVAGGGYVVVKKVLPDPTLEQVSAAAGDIKELGGDDPAVILTPRGKSKGIVLYAHGNNQTEREVLSGRNVAPLAAELLEAGYTVVSARAEGNAWGNPASVAEYKAVVGYARSQTEADDLFVVGESMGGLPSLQLASSLDGVKAWVGIYPVCDARTVADHEDIREGLERAYPDGNAGAVSPVKMPRVPMMFWASPGDTRVSKARNTDACAATAKESGVLVEVVSTTGNHSDPSNFDADRMIRFFDSK